MMSYRDGDTVLRGAFVERWRWRGRAPRWPGWRASTRAAHGFTHRQPSTAPGVAFDAVADARSASALRLFLAEL